MKYAQEEIVKAVKAVIDENIEDAEALTNDIEQRSMDDVIKALVVDGVAAVLQAAPIWKVEGEDIKASPITWHEIGGKKRRMGEETPITRGDVAYWGSIAMPEDMMRLALFEMSDWAMPVAQPITDQDARYEQQKSRFRGVRGNTDRPVVALHNGQIEFYCCNNNSATITTAIYIRWPRWETEEGDGGKNTYIDIPQKLYRAAVYQTAALTMQELGEGQTGKDLAALVLSFI